jgi:hypothetical protein
MQRHLPRLLLLALLHLQTSISITAPDVPPHRWPAQCNVLLCGRKLWRAFERARGMPSALLELGNPASVSAYDWLVRLGSSEQSTLDWLRDAKHGDVHFRDNKRTLPKQVWHSCKGLGRDGTLL